jgi:hypothetical protein
MFFGEVKQRNVTLSTSKVVTKQELLKRNQEQRERRNQSKLTEKAYSLIRSALQRRIIYKALKPRDFREEVVAFLIFCPFNYSKLVSITCKIVELNQQKSLIWKEVLIPSGRKSAQFEECILYNGSNGDVQTGYLLKRLLNLVLERGLYDLANLNFMFVLNGHMKHNGPISRILKEVFQSRKYLKCISKFTQLKQLWVDCIAFGNPFIIDEFLIVDEPVDLPLNIVDLENILGESLNTVSLYNTNEKLNILRNLSKYDIFGNTKDSLIEIYVKFVSRLLYSLPKHIFHEFQDEEEEEEEILPLSSSFHPIIYRLLQKESILSLANMRLDVIASYLCCILKLFSKYKLEVTSIVLLFYPKDFCRVLLRESSLEPNSDVIYLTASIISRQLKTMSDEEFFAFDVFEKDFLVNYIQKLKVFLQLI